EQGCSAIRAYSLLTAGETLQDLVLRGIDPDQGQLWQLLSQQVAVALFVGALGHDQRSSRLLMLTNQPWHARKVLIPHGICKRAFFCQRQTHFVADISVGVIYGPARMVGNQVCHVVLAHTGKTKKKPDRSPGKFS